MSHPAGIRADVASLPHFSPERRCAVAEIFNHFVTPRLWNDSPGPANQTVLTQTEPGSRVRSRPSAHRLIVSLTRDGSPLAHPVKSTGVHGLSQHFGYSSLNHAPSLRLVRDSLAAVRRTTRRRSCGACCFDPPVPSGAPPVAQGTPEVRSSMARLCRNCVAPVCLWTPASVLHRHSASLSGENLDRA